MNSDYKNKNTASSMIDDGNKMAAGVNRIDSNNDATSNIDPTNFEYIITDMWSQMKNLEGKYIDLANFYKQELVSNGRTSNINGGSDGSSSNASKSAVGGVVSSSQARGG